MAIISTLIAETTLKIENMLICLKKRVGEVDIMQNMIHKYVKFQNLKGGNIIKQYWKESETSGNLLITSKT